MNTDNKKERAKQTIHLLLAVNLVFTPMFFLPLSADYYYFPKIFLVYITISCIISFCILNRDNPFCLRSFTEKALCIYLALLILSTVFSGNLEQSLWGRPFREEGLIALFAYALLFIFAKKYFKFTNKLLFLFLFSASIAALYGILQYFGIDPIPKEPMRIARVNYAYSTFGNPNFFGSFLVLLLPISVYTYVTMKRKIFLLSSGVIYLALLCTITRGAWLGALFGFLLIVFYVIKYKYDKRPLVLVILLFSVITIIMNLYSNGFLILRFNSIHTELNSVMNNTAASGNAGSGRIIIWKIVINIIQDHPFLGIGIDNLADEIFNKYQQLLADTLGYNIIVDKAHNEYLHIAVSTGIPSLLLYLTFIGSIVSKGFRNVKNNRLIIPVLCSVVGYLVQAFFNISVVSVAYIYWILLGVLFQFSDRADQDVKRTTKPATKEASEPHTMVN